MTKQERTNKLTSLMEMTPPNWLTAEKYQLFLENRNTLKEKFNESLALQDLLGKDANNVVKDDAWRSWGVTASPKFLVDKYRKEELLSDPTSGQDPKTYTNENLKTASFHAANHWGSKKQINQLGIINTPSEWINFGTFNLITIDGRLCIVPINVEHRLWGLIGFPLNLVKLESKKSLWYYHRDLPEVYDSELGKMVNGIVVNDMYISDIVTKCNELGASVTNDTIEERFYQNTFKFQFLPFYNQQETEEYFKAINSSSSKSDAQLFHAEPHDVQYWAKDFSSPKVSKFIPAGKPLHPLFETMAPKKLIQLEALMITHTILQRNLNNGKYIPHSDKALVGMFYINKNNVTEDIKQQVIEDLDWLYSVISKSDTMFNFTKQIAQHFLKIRDYLDDTGKIIADKTLFINSWNEWFSNNQLDSKTGQMTLFAGHWRKSTEDEYKKAWTIILNDFLSKGEVIGVMNKSNSIPRIFSYDLIYDSYIKNNKLDINNEILTSKPVGGHIISDMELIRMTTNERDLLFKTEGLSDTFNFEKNCRAMSHYHNMRMGVLRLSEYLPIINDDKLVREARIKKYNELKQREILV